MIRLFLILLSILHLSSHAVSQESSLFFAVDEEIAYYLLEINIEKNKYIYSKHNSKRVQVDRGVVLRNGNKISFKSEVQYSAFNPYLHSIWFLKHNALYPDRISMKLNKYGHFRIKAEDVLVDYEFEGLEEFKSNKRIVVSTTSESMIDFKGKKFKDAFFEILTDKTPVYHDIVLGYYLGPDSYTHYANDKKIDWDQDFSSAAVLDMFGTIVHESVHMANTIDSVLIQPDKLTYIGETSIVSTKTMTSFFENRGVTDSVFRFDTYVKNASDNLISNSRGVYGLMDEFSAYYHDVKASFILYKSYKDLGEEYDAYSDYVASTFSSTYLAYYEFNLFIGGYLTYLKQNNNSVYKETLSNKALRSGYTELNLLYGELVSEIEVEFKHSESFIHFSNQMADPTKRVLEQFLPELELFKSSIYYSNKTDDKK
jgi:hypothetical protein